MLDLDDIDPIELLTPFQQEVLRVELRERQIALNQEETCPD